MLKSTIQFQRISKFANLYPFLSVMKHFAMYVPATPVMIDLIIKLQETLLFEPLPLNATKEQFKAASTEQLIFYARMVYLIILLLGI